MDSRRRNDREEQAKRQEISDQAVANRPLLFTVMVREMI